MGKHCGHRGETGRGPAMGLMTWAEEGDREVTGFSESHRLKVGVPRAVSTKNVHLTKKE